MHLQNNRRNTMSREKRTITNESGKSITIMIDPEDAIQHINSIEWTVTAAQWFRLVRESDNTVWRTEDGAVIEWTCHPVAYGCKYPGRD